MSRKGARGYKRGERKKRGDLFVEELQKELPRKVLQAPPPDYSVPAQTHTPIPTYTYPELLVDGTANPDPPRYRVVPKPPTRPVAAPRTVDPGMTLPKIPPVSLDTAVGPPTPEWKHHEFETALDSLPPVRQTMPKPIVPAQTPQEIGPQSPICPLLGRECVGMECMWYDAAYNCSVVALKHSSSECVGKIGILSSQLSYLMQRIDQ